MSEYQCPLCVTRGKTWRGDDPRCGFNSDGSFRLDNWNCATLNELARVDVYFPSDGDDQSLAITALDGGRFVILSLYKRRGRVEGAWLNDGEIMVRLTLDVAEEALVYRGWAVKFEDESAGGGA